MPGLKIFVSHSHQDNQFCRQLVEFLRDNLPRETDIFYDERTLHGGDPWIQNIQREVLARPIFVVICSPNAVASEWVREETNLALNEAVWHRERRIIPVRYHDCDIGSLAALLLNRQIVDCAFQGIEAGFQQLVEAIQTAGSPDIHDVSRADSEHVREFSTRVHEAYQAHDWDEVVRTGRFALQMAGNERNGDVLGELGIALVEIGEKEEGARRLEAALVLQPTRVDFWRAQARLLIDHPGEIDRVIAALDKALVVTRSATERREILVEEYDTLVRAGRYDAAVLVIDQMARFNPEDPEIWTRKGDALRNAGRVQEAITAYDRSLSLSPKQARVWQVNGQLLLASGRADEAVVALDRALTLNSNDDAVWNAKARALYTLGRLDEALATADQALTLVPQDSSLWVIKGNTIRALGRVAEALDVYDHALGIAPNDLTILNAKADTFVTLRRFADAARVYDLMLSIKPNDLPILVRRAYALVALGNMDAAVAAFDHVLAHTPNDAPTLAAKGDLLRRAGRYVEADALYTRAINAQRLGSSTQNPPVPKAQIAAYWYNRSFALHHLKRSKEALTACDQALQLDPGNSRLWSAKGMLLYIERRYIDALAAQDRAFSLDQSNLDIYTGRALALWALKRYTEALTHCDYVLSLDANNPTARQTKQYCLYALNRPTEAMALETLPPEPAQIPVELSPSSVEEASV